MTLACHGQRPLDPAERKNTEGAHRGRGAHLRSKPGVPPTSRSYEHTLFFEGSKVLTFSSLSIFGLGLSTFEIGQGVGSL